MKKYLIYCLISYSILLTIHFCVDSPHAGRAIERTQRSEHECQRLHRIRQSTDPSFLNLDRHWANDPSCQIQVQFKGAFRCPAY